MPQYVILQDHPPDNCPVTNKAVREFAKKALSNLDANASKMGVKVLSYDHLDPAHRALLRLEAPSAEAVRDFVVAAGFFHFTGMELFLVSPIAELLKNVDQVPTIY